jgi:inner membrane protein
VHSPHHAGFLAAALATHALVGYTLGAVAFDAPWAGLVAGLLPDVDLLVPAAWGAPLAHRGLTHSALAVGVVVALAAGGGRRSAGTRSARRLAGAAGLGFGAHLLLDATTPMGVPLAWPLSTEYVGISLAGHSPPVTAFLWTACLLAVWRGGDQRLAELVPT